MNEMLTTSDWWVIAAMLVLIFLLCLSPDIVAWMDRKQLDKNWETHFDDDEPVLNNDEYDYGHDVNYNNNTEEEN